MNFVVNMGSIFLEFVKYFIHMTKTEVFEFSLG
jgi:hypothetical protein